MKKINFLIKESTNLIPFSLSLFVAYSYLYVIFAKFKVGSQSDYLMIELFILFLMVILFCFVFQLRLKGIPLSKEFIRESYFLASVIFLIGTSFLILIDSYYALRNSAQYGDLDIDIIRNDKVISFNKLIYPLTFIIGTIVFLLHRIMSLRKNRIKHFLVKILKDIYSFIMPIVLGFIIATVLGIFTWFLMGILVFGIAG